MRTLIFLCTALLAAGQQATNPPTQQAKAPDPKLHADVVRLLELNESKKHIEEYMIRALPASQAALMKACGECDPALGDEWVKRMVSRMDMNAYLAVGIRAYEKYLTDEDVLGLIDLANRVKESPTAAPSDALKTKLTSVLPSLQAEIMGGTTQLGAKLGAEIEQELRKEHPEYFKPKQK